ncbi:hypothetical protein PtA15_12A390 [Puccinia triticina]|uniref:Uncharacterized protein n=1 Tax=Puccinia triticina TaxID=208348 RepID=A0ABY7D227_9BASI|nr:uncharacterized protein PtA15_12A390 [Puccinia triticina]WAQ90401.1 hypothetical protein PtA15_12A390 [Puccinia triticina]WAR61717.1 hypothetical protein PtB15_12B407 [Puccinia triticina]
MMSGSTAAQDERISYSAFYPKTFLFSLFVAAYSHRRRSLQLSGAVTANLIGYLTLANPNPIFGGALLSFFTLGTIATKYKQKIKAGLVDESEQDCVPSDQHHHHISKNDKTNKLQTGGPSPTPTGHPRPAGRDWKQVLCNAWFGTLCALSYAFFDPLSRHELLLGSSYDNPFEIGPLRKALVSASLAYWAGCAGDTVSNKDLILWSV